MSEARALAVDAASSASSAAAAAERASDLAAVLMASTQAAAENFPSGKEPEIQNPWNRFQHENRNRGWNSQKMASEYKRQCTQECLEPPTQNQTGHSMG